MVALKLTFEISCVILLAMFKNNTKKSVSTKEDEKCRAEGRCGKGYTQSGNRVLFASFDVVPAPKGASTHILQSTKALAAHIGPVTFIGPGAPGLAGQETLAAGVVAERVPLPQGRHFLKRVEAYQLYLRDWLAEHGSSFSHIHFRDIWSGLPILDFLDEKQRQAAQALKEDENIHAARMRDDACDGDGDGAGAGAGAGAYGEKAPEADEYQRPQVVMEVNGLPSFELGYHYPAVRENKGFTRKLRAQECSCLLAADRVLTVSPTNARHIESMGILPERVTVIPNGVDVERFAPPEGARPGTASAGTGVGAAAGPSVKREVPRLLYVGTLAPWQGVTTLLHALKKVVRERPVEVVFAGRGRKVWLKDALALANELKVLPYVDFRGAVAPEAVPALVAGADLCLAPLERTRRNTRQGCCPIKILEYMACARPFVAADLPVVRALLPEGLDCSEFLVLPGKPGHLAARILALLEPSEAHQEEICKLAWALRDYVVEQRTWEHSNRALVEFYGKLG